MTCIAMPAASCVPTNSVWKIEPGLPKSTRVKAQLTAIAKGSVSMLQVVQPATVLVVCGRKLNHGISFAPSDEVAMTFSD